MTRVFKLAAVVMAMAFSFPLVAQAQQSRGQAIAQAYEAARLDAYRNLLEAVSGLSIRGSTTVQNLAVANSEIRTQVEEFIRGATIVEETLEDDGVARVLLEVDLGRLSRLLGEEVGDGVTKIRQEGFGAPPPPPGSAPAAASSGSAVQTAVFGSPEAWNKEPEGTEDIGGVVTVVGQAAHDMSRARNAAQARLMAERAATADAYRRVLEYVYGISVSSTTTVKDLCLADDRVDTEVSGFVRGAKIEGVNHADGIAEVTMSIDLSPLRDILPRN